MEETVYKFIDEGMQEHKEMRAFIREFKTSNKLLFKERNNSLSELRFEVHGLSKAEKRKRRSSAMKVLRKSKATTYQFAVHRNPSSNAKGLDKLVYQSDLESYNSIGNNSDDNSDTEMLIRRIDSVNTSSSEAQKTARTDGVNSIGEMQGSNCLEDVRHQGNNSWVSPIHVVPKKGGTTVVLNYNNELIPSCIVAGWWVLLLQGFDIKIKDKKGANNLAADHLLRLENPDLGVFTKEEIADEFPDEHLMILKAELNDDEPWLCLDNIMRQCVAGSEILEILAHCHSGPTRGHYSASITGRKVYESGFFWPSIFKDAKDYIIRCDACQRSGNISSKSEMPQNNIQVKAQALPTNDDRVVIKILRGLFAKFGVPKYLISDRGTSVGYNPKDWSEKFNDASWAFRTAYKTPTGCTPFRLVYGKACHLLVEIKHKAYWALKQCNMDLAVVAKNRFIELNELMELRDRAYENT
ncbi:reverse transcriptase domain-containing protein [Tanacetum coccineum]